MTNPPRPIVVLGAARSGTKFLRDVLGASAEVAVVPHDVNFIWRTGNEASPHDALTPGMCSDELARAIRAMLLRAAGIAGEEDRRRLVEKTVSNTLRLEHAARVLPDADFVHIVRDGRDVVESSLRQWQSPVDWRYMLDKARSFPLRNYRYAIWYVVNRLGARGGPGRRPVWGVRYEGIEEDLQRLSLPEVCARQWVASVSAVREASRRRPDIRLRELRYEDLVDSETRLAGLVDWLGLSQRDAVLERYRRTVERGGGRRWSAELAEREVEGVLRIARPLLDELGYVA